MRLRLTLFSYKPLPFSYGNFAGKILAGAPDTSCYKNNMIYIIKLEGLHQKRSTPSSFSHVSVKLGYYPSPFQFVYFPISVLSTGQIISFFDFDRLSLKHE